MLGRTACGFKLDAGRDIAVPVPKGERPGALSAHVKDTCAVEFIDCSALGGQFIVKDQLSVGALTDMTFA